MLTKGARLYPTSSIPNTVAPWPNKAAVCPTRVHTHTHPGVGPGGYRPGSLWLSEFLSLEAPTQGLLLFSRAPHFLCARHKTRHSYMGTSLPNGKRGSQRPSNLTSRCWPHPTAGLIPRHKKQALPVSPRTHFLFTLLIPNNCPGGREGPKRAGR